MFLTSNLYERLCKEYDKYGTLYIGFDFDNTVQDYQTKEPIWEVIFLLRTLSKRGMKLILCTCGDRLEDKLTYCKSAHIPVFAVNHNPDINYGEGKPYYNVLLDDRAGGAEVYNCLTKLIKYIDEKNRGNSSKTSASS